MAAITKIFKPRRGLNSTMTGAKANTVLASGEMFFEVQGTTVGQSKCKVKMGDGTTAYSSLPYALGDTSSDPITFTANSATTADAALASAASGATLATIVAAMKRAISLNTTAITKLNDDSNKIAIAIGESFTLDKEINVRNNSNIVFSSGNKCYAIVLIRINRSYGHLNFIINRYGEEGRRVDISVLGKGNFLNDPVADTTGNNIKVRYYDSEAVADTYACSIHAFVLYGTLGVST